jgi:hypothetical protein
VVKLRHLVAINLQEVSVYTAVIRRDADVIRNVHSKKLKKGVLAQELDQGHENLLDMIRIAGAEIYEGGEFNHRDAGVFIMDETGLVVSFYKVESHWKVLLNYSTIPNNELLDALVHPHG